MPKPTTHDAYIASAPAAAQKHLHEIRALLQKVAPKAVEAIKWGNPVFEEGRILFSYTAYKDHLNFMPTSKTLDLFRDELNDYKLGEHTIQFRYDKPLPKALITKMAKHRLKDVRENDAKWM